MRVHPSNFRVTGFTESPSIEELSAVARAAGVRLIDDVGSGCLLETAPYGLAPEPTPQSSIKAGADVVMFSGDKLLGGPQGGLIVGRRESIDRMKRHPLARAVRLDKASIAGLAATLRIYAEGEPEKRIPVWRMIATPLDEIASRAAGIARQAGPSATTLEGRSMIGGGSLPEEGLPTVLVAIAPSPERNETVIAGALRDRDIIARVERGRVLLDPRTFEPAHDGRVAEACAAASSGQE
jgi:L-seryl-tRNA(Ser) seleniumtransferase